MNANYAGFWIRFLAHLIDSLILNFATGILQYIVTLLFYVMSRLQSGEYASLQEFFAGVNPMIWTVLNAGIYFCLAFPYYVWGHFHWGTTVGKKVLKIYVVSADGLAPITLGQSIGRFFGYGASYAVFLAGFIMAAFHPEKRALHDLLVKTVVIHKNA